MAYYYSVSTYKKKFLLTLLACLGIPMSACANNHEDSNAIHSPSHPINVIIEPYLNQPTNIKKFFKTKNAKQLKQMRIMHIDLDYIFDSDQQQQQSNIQALIQRIQQIQPNTIFLQAFADPDANGSANLVYFENRHIPMRANLFPELLKQIRQHTQVKQIYAWLPLIAWELPKSYQLQYVKHSQDKTHGYIRLSPFDPTNLKYIAEIFQDFIQKNAVDGVLYHDDITLNDFEDASVVARQVYQQWGYDLKLLEEPQHPQQSAFAAAKTAYLDQLAAGITRLLQHYRPQLLTARNTYAPIVLQPESEKWFSQSVSSTLRYYNYNAIMAMPYMEQAGDHHQFYLDLIQQSKKYDPDLDRTIFELQATDWRSNQKIATSELVQTIHFLQQHGVKHIGYYPDDFAQAHPAAVEIKSVFQVDHSR